jgi:gluconate 2-dehydrogenase gamma chain
MDEQPRIITRRELLRGAGVVGAAAVTAPAASLITSPGAAEAAPTAAPQAAQAARAAAAVGGPYENLTAAEADLLEAVVDRLIPTDALGPGAKEAGVMRYIDRALGGALASSRASYAANLPALDNYARSSRGQGFLELSDRDKDSVLIDCETGGALGFSGSSAQFFGMVLGHTRQGMFGDPFYGGNANFAGWDLIGYPGVRTNVSAADQRALEANQLTPNHRSAYDNAGFNKATVQLDRDHDHDHDHDGPDATREVPAHGH